MSGLLDSIKQANDIKKIPERDYPKLAEEIRNFMLDSVSKTGGHLASNFGTVDLTIALHAVLDFPKDKIVWDVGHQSYTHKILTGRKDDFKNLRHYGGISGFPKRRESECDSFDTGHSSTSISAALGMATASSLLGTDEKIVAVIGDAAISGGMALEALNNVAALKRNLVIVLNDNGMSISPNIGSMSNYLNKARLSKHYNELKEDVETSLSRIPKIGERLTRRLKNGKDKIKNFLMPRGELFRDLGITYIGPVDGHDISAMISIFRRALRLDHPILIHVNTQKGKGYRPAENNPSKFHGIKAFDKESGEEIGVGANRSYTDVFSDALLKEASNNKNVVAITAAMTQGTGLVEFGQRFPDRFFDVGIAEEHAVTFAAGLAASGMVPFVAIYSSFMQRAYDQILHDVCMQNLPVKFILDRAGIVGEDGETHQGMFDLSFLLSMPNMCVIAPKDGKELEDAIEFSAKSSGPVAIRFEKGEAYKCPLSGETPISSQTSEVLQAGSKIAVIAVGSMVRETMDAKDMLEKDGIYPTLVNARFLKPLDKEMVRRLSDTHSHILVVEEGIKSGGYGEKIAALAAQEQLDLSVSIMAVDDVFVGHGSIKELRKSLGLDSQAIYDRVVKLLGKD